MNDQELIEVPANKMRQIGTLVELVRRMPNGDPRYALFLGAGASLSSGIPTSERLITQWQRRLFLDETGQTAWRPHYEKKFNDWVRSEYQRWKSEWQAAYGRQPSDYSLLFSYACPDTDARQGFIERICSGCEPGPGYIYLASLALAGYFQTFLTTNFDDLIHDALFRYAGLKPMVCAFDSQVSSIRLQSPRTKIVKLHGDFLFSNLRNVGQEVGRLDRNMGEKFERTCENYGLIVIGYGGCDQSVMAPVRAMLHRQDCLTHGLHWCIYSGRSTSRGVRDRGVLIPQELYRMWESYNDKVHLYEAGSFDEVMEAFYYGCRCTPPPELAFPQEKALYARLRDGIENADQTWRLTASFSRLLSEFREGATLPPPEILTLLDEADQYHREGLEKLKCKDLPAAGMFFHRAITNASNALSQATPSQMVRALRRRSGSLTSAAEILGKQSEQDTARKFEQGDNAEFIKLAIQARDDVRQGLTIDQKLRTPPDLRGHRLNLWYNGLISYAYLLAAGAQLSQADLIEALNWLEGMTSDEIHSNEYLMFLGDELGGTKLVETLRNLSEGMSA